MISLSNIRTHLTRKRGIYLAGGLYLAVSVVASGLQGNAGVSATPSTGAAPTTTALPPTKPVDSKPVGVTPTENSAIPAEVSEAVRGIAPATSSGGVIATEQPVKAGDRQVNPPPLVDPGTPVPDLPKGPLSKDPGPNTLGVGPATAVPAPPAPTKSRPQRNWIDQTKASADAKSEGCITCHSETDAPTMHVSPNVVLGCTDCHGGHAQYGLKRSQRGLKKTDPAYREVMNKAHVQPRHPEYWLSSANPINSTVLLNHESPEFIKFVNPGDLRVAQEACGDCHGKIIDHVTHSMMNHGGMLWNAAAYNNGSIQLKNAIVGQAYGRDGMPLKLLAPFPPTEAETKKLGILPIILPLPRFNRSNPGNILRIFEKGGFFPLQLGVPTLDEPPGKPDRRLSDRGLGTLNRTDPIILGAQKTRLHDPLLGFFGSNDRAGDFRSSGCSACHVVYANDRSPTNSGWWAQFGHQGLSFSKDPTIPKDERGHPVFHKFSRSIPSSLCMNCHMHQGNAFVNPYLGYTWWDQETDGALMYPKKQHDPTDEEMVAATRSNPEAAAARGLWGNLDFLEKVSELNPKLKHTQFADYHGHGWVFRAIFKKDRKGNLLDLDDKIVAHGDFKNAVHLKDIHLAKGMQCVDCHFEVDVHGNGLIYGEVRNATTIMCIDCHGTTSDYANLRTSGVSGHFDFKNRRIVPVDLAKGSTPFPNRPRFEWIDTETPNPRLIQRSMMQPDMQWEVPQTKDVINPLHPRYNAKAAYSKTLERDGKTWGGEVPKDPKACQSKFAHSNESMDCQICHSSWATSCFGCHLPMKANQRVPLNKYEGVLNRNFTTYNPQVVRDDVYQLGIDGTVKKNRMAVLRSSSAVVVGSQNQNREWFYSQAQTVSAEGYSGQAYNPHFPHTTSGKGTTKGCTDCHLSKANDNNAWMASLLGFGTGTVNFFGRYAWVGGEGELNGIVWTETDEPQSVIGSSFHEIAYPRNYGEHVEKHGRELQTAYHHHAGEIHDLTLRGEYLYTAGGKAGLLVYDVANIDQKGFSERYVTAPVSPLGQMPYVRTPYATSVAMPSTYTIDPNRVHLPVNEEQPIFPYYGYVFVTDREEGLVIVNVATFYDGNPENNFLKKDVVFNPDNKLAGAEYAVCAGHRVWICCERGIVVVDVENPLKPRIVAEYSGPAIKNPRAISVQFRYAFVTDEEGLKVLDVTDLPNIRPVKGAVVPLRHAKKLYVARTYAYVANGKDGLAIIDVENPERPKLDQMFTAGGALDDVHAVQIGSVAASMYALVADGKNGFRVLQMISPDTVPGAAGFSPRPKPRLIATYHTHHPALAVSRGLDRDRVVDETGGQTVVFGRRGSRPFRVNEMLPFYRKKSGALYTVEDVKIASYTEIRKIKDPVTGRETELRIPRTRLEYMSGKPVPAPPQPELIPPLFVKNYSAFSEDYALFKKRRARTQKPVPNTGDAAQLALYTEAEDQKEAAEFLRRAQDLLTDLDKAAEAVKPGAAALLRSKQPASQLQEISAEIQKAFPTAVPTITPEQLQNAPKLNPRDNTLSPE